MPGRNVHNRHRDQATPISRAVLGKGVGNRRCVNDCQMSTDLSTGPAVGPAVRLR
jgi:hypothetical protein